MLLISFCEVCFVDNHSILLELNGGSIGRASLERPMEYMSGDFILWRGYTSEH